MGRAGVVSAYLFYKDIDNFIYNTDLAGTGQWAAFDEALSFQNGSSAKLYGLELAYSQKLDWLPAVERFVAGPMPPSASPTRTSRVRACAAASTCRTIPIRSAT